MMILIRQLTVAVTAAGIELVAAGGGAMAVQEALAPDVSAALVQHAPSSLRVDSAVPPVGGRELVVGDAEVERILNRHLLDAGIRLAWLRPSRNTIELPETFRHRPTPPRDLVESLAASRGLRVTWITDRHGVFHREPEDDAVAALTRDLADPDGVVRREAAHRARFVYDLRVPGMLARLLLSDEADEDTLFYAAGSLDRMGLHTEVTGASATVQGLGWGLALLAEPGLAAHIARSIGEAPTFRKERIWQGLGWAATPDAIRILTDEAKAFPTIHIGTLAGAIALTGRTELVPVIKAMIADKDANSIIAVAGQLWRLQSAETFAFLDRIVQEVDRHPQFRETRRMQIMRVLGSLGGPEAVRRIQDLADQAEPGTRFATYARAMFQAGAGAQAFEFLAPRLDQPMAGFQEYGLMIAALAESRDPRALPIVASRLGSQDSTVRQGAVHAIGKVGTPEWVPRLVALIHDPTISVGSSAVVALSSLGTPEAIAELVKALDSPFPQIKHMARVQLGTQVERVPWDQALDLAGLAAAWGGPDATEIISHLVQREEPEAVAIGFGLLGEVPFQNMDIRIRLPRPEALPFMEQALAEGDLNARNVARQGLRNLGGPKAIALLTAQLGRTGGDDETMNYLLSLRSEGSPAARRSVSDYAEAYLQILNQEPEASGRIHRFQQVISVADSVAPGRMMEIVRRESDLRARFLMAGFLARQPDRDPEAWDLLREAAQHPDLAVRRILFDSNAVVVFVEGGKAFYEAWLARETDPDLRRLLLPRAEGRMSMVAPREASGPASEPPPPVPDTAPWDR